MIYGILFLRPWTKIGQNRKYEMGSRKRYILERLETFPFPNFKLLEVVFFHHAASSDLRWGAAGGGITFMKKLGR
ncbi:MAG: hypothetical protein R2828_03115 [Saprospiraceae bacterium]